MANALLKLQTGLCITQASPSDAERGFVANFSVLILKSRTTRIFHIGDTPRLQDRRRGHPPTHSMITKPEFQPAKSTWIGGLGLDTSGQIDYRCEGIELDVIFLLTRDGLHDHGSGSEDNVTYAGQSRARAHYRGHEPTAHSLAVSVPAKRRRRNRWLSACAKNATPAIVARASWWRTRPAAIGLS